MANLLRVKMRWSGFTGGPGYSIFHFRDFDGSGEPDLATVDGATGKVLAFATALRPLIAAGVTLTVENDVEVLEDTTGTLVDVITGAVRAPQVSNATVSNYSAASGAVITWRTQGIRKGRRIRGRTFLVPMAGGSYETNGTLAPATITALTSASTALIDGTGNGDLGVYARPSGPGATDGEWAVVRSFTIPDMAAVLRSRR